MSARSTNLRKKTNKTWLRKNHAICVREGSFRWDHLHYIKPVKGVLTSDPKDHHILSAEGEGKVDLRPVHFADNKFSGQFVLNPNTYFCLSRQAWPFQKNKSKWIQVHMGDGSTFCTRETYQGSFCTAFVGSRRAFYLWTEPNCHAVCQLDVSMIREVLVDGPFSSLALIWLQPDMGQGQRSVNVRTNLFYPERPCVLTAYTQQSYKDIAHGLETLIVCDLMEHLGNLSASKLAYRRKMIVARMECTRTTKNHIELAAQGLCRQSLREAHYSHPLLEQVYESVPSPPENMKAKEYLALVLKECFSIELAE